MTAPSPGFSSQAHSRQGVWDVWGVWDDGGARQPFTAPAIANELPESRCTSRYSASTGTE